MQFWIAHAVRHTDEPTVLEKAAVCGRHLLANRSRSRAPRAWRTLEPIPLTGFSHGAAGIAYALLRLSDAMQDQDFASAACEGMAYERSVFSRDAANWPDFRGMGDDDPRPTYMTSWCHGALGSAWPAWALYRLSLPQKSMKISKRQCIPLRCTHPGGVDHLCCGSLGRIELLLAAGNRLAGLSCTKSRSGKPPGWLAEPHRQMGLPTVCQLACQRIQPWPVSGNGRDRL